VRLSRVAFSIIVAAWCLRTSDVRADELEWQPSWRRVGAPEYVVTAGALSTYLALRFVGPRADAAAWRGPALFDAPIRSALRLETRPARDGSETAAHVLAYTLLAQSLLVDPWLAAGVARQSPEVGWQLFVIGAQSHAVSTVLNATTKLLTARERPYGQACSREPRYHESCEGDDRFRSFYSSHSSLAATSAGLVCAHHANVPLYGKPALDFAACASAGVLALSVGALRIASDEHWATDVLVGQLIGFSIGYLLPALVYYRQPSRTDIGAARESAPLSLEAAREPRLFTFATSF
jgi:membrane-associated phospholipid phosphatase